MDSKKQQDKIIIEITKDFKGINVSIPRLKKLVRSICSRFELAEATINIAIVGDAKSKKLNKQFLNRNRPTDCLSFDLSDKTPDSARSFELAINAETAIRQAKLRGHRAEAELALYITHGLLHNLGFDDSESKQAKRMHETEDEILQQAGFGLIYNKDASC